MASVDHEIGDILTSLRLALPNWNVDPSSKIQLLSISENAVFHIQDNAHGRPFVVRVHRESYNSKIEISSELSWIDALKKDTNLHIVSPVTGRNDIILQQLSVGNLAVGFEFIDGRPPDTSDDRKTLFYELGSMTAILHHHARTWNLPDDFIRKRWDFNNTLGPNGIWGDWRMAPGLDAEKLLFFERVVEHINNCLLEFGNDRDKFGLIHGDLKMANLMLSNDDLYLLDFDDCGLSWFLYDYGCAMTDDGIGPNVDTLKSAWIQGYRSNGNLLGEEEAMLPIFHLLRRLITMAWAGSRAQNPTALNKYGACYTQQTEEIAQYYLQI